ncbi:MAG: ATP-dependent helicase, partial [Cyclobacteriaceae bacterium]|nr:ATP-dependent helicase [Cyclobacteriaceae bacterium]
MNVNPQQPFQLIYSLYQHEYLGFLFESFVVQLNDKGKLTFTHQNISAKNAHEFASGLVENDYLLIEKMDSMQQDVILNHFSKKKLKPNEFFLKTYDKDTGDKLLQREIDTYLERRRTVIMPLLVGKKVYEMGSDGEPAWKKIKVLEEKASILFHFRKNEENTHYFPTIKLRDEKLDFRDKESYIISSEPAWMMVGRELFTFTKEITGAKLKPFLKKKFILIPKNVEETYYEKFIAPLVATFDVYAQGFDIKTESYDPQPTLTISEVKQARQPSMDLFQEEKDDDPTGSKVLIELSYQYGSHKFRADQLKDVSVSLEKKDGEYIFHRIKRKTHQELEIIDQLKSRGLPLRNSRATLNETKAFAWLNINQTELVTNGFIIRQQSNGGKKYFLGESRINITIEEKIDWFDIKAVVMFGEYEIPF